MARWEYSDEEWAQWRREQNQGSRPNPSPAPAPVATAAGLSTQRPLPDVWKVSYEARPASEAYKPRSKKDASDVVRLCNRRLQCVWNDWQNQVEAEKAKVASTLALSFQSMACVRVGVMGQQVLRRWQKVQAALVWQPGPRKHVENLDLDSSAQQMF